MEIDLRLDCDRFVLSEEHLLTAFDCGDEDLNEFFNRDALQRSLSAVGGRNFTNKVYVL